MSDAEETQDISQIPVEDLQVEVKPLHPQSKVGEPDFNKALYALLSEGKSVWRTSVTLAQKLDVDVVDLDSFLRRQPAVAVRPAKEEGIVLYALVNRLGNNKEETQEKQAPKVRLLPTEEDRYAVASFHDCLLLITASLDKYALKIHARSSEAFTQLVKAKESLEAGVVLLASKTGCDLNKLPKV